MKAALAPSVRCTASSMIGIERQSLAIELHELAAPGLVGSVLDRLIDTAGTAGQRSSAARACWW
jgi:hypothetical protein